MSKSKKSSVSNDRVGDRWAVASLSIYAFMGLGSMATMSIGAVILLAGLMVGFGGPLGLWRRIAEGTRAPAARIYFWISLAYCGVILVSLAGAVAWPLTFAGRGPHPDWAHTAGKLWYFFFPLLILAGLKPLSDSDRSKVVRAWLLTAGLMGAVGIVQFFTGWPRPQLIPNANGYYHATVFFGHHLSAASILIFPFFVAADLFWKKTGSSWLRLPRWALAAIAALVGVTLILGFSRMLWVALPAGGVVWLLAALPWKRALAVLGVLVLGALGLMRLPIVQERLDSQMGKERSYVWEASWEIFKARPVLGAGFRQTEELSGHYLTQKWGRESMGAHAHDNVLEVLADTGIAGLLTWLTWNGFIFWALITQIRRKGKNGIPFALGLFCAWIVFHLNGITQVNFFEGKVMHQMMWSVGWVLLGMTATGREAAMAGSGKGKANGKKTRSRR